MIAADEVLASARCGIDTHAGVLVKARALAANACLERETDARYLAGVYGIYVPENRPIVDESLIKTFCRPPRDVAADAKIVDECEVGSEARIHAATQGLCRVIYVGDVKVRRRLRMYSADSELAIELLRMGRNSKSKA